MKYLVKTIKHTTGEEFTDIIKVKNNEDYVIVEAESKEEAKRKYVLEVDDAHWEGMREELLKIINKYIELAKKEDTPLNIRFMPISEYRTMIYKKGQWVNMVFLKTIGIILIINTISVILGVLAIALTGIDIIGVFLMLCGVSIAAIKGSKFLEENKK